MPPPSRFSQDHVAGVVSISRGVGYAAARASDCTVSPKYHSWRTPSCGDTASIGRFVERRPLTKHRPDCATSFICSMSAVGSCADNAAAESFFEVLKRERVNRQHYRTRAEARADIFDYIERCHNPRQRRRLDMQQQGQRLLTQPSVISG